MLVFFCIFFSKLFLFFGLYNKLFVFFNILIILFKWGVIIGLLKDIVKIKLLEFKIFLNGKIIIFVVLKYKCNLLFLINWGYIIIFFIFVVKFCNFLI